MEKVPVTLIDGEKIVREIKPLPRLKGYWFVSNIFALIIILIIFFSFAFAKGFRAFHFIFIIIFVLILGWIIASIFLKYYWEHYFITNKRIIKRTGILGYSYYSAPLERISDVSLSKSLLERIFNMGSLHIQTLAGQVTTGTGKIGAELALLGLDNPEEVQKKILELVQEKRKREKLSF